MHIMRTRLLSITRYSNIDDSGGLRLDSNITLRTPEPHLELVLVVLQSLHDHTHSLHGALQPAVHTVEAVHAARHVG